MMNLFTDAVNAVTQVRCIPFGHDYKDHGTALICRECGHRVSK